MKLVSSNQSPRASTATYPYIIIDNTRIYSASGTNFFTYNQNHWWTNSCWGCVGGNVSALSSTDGKDWVSLTFSGNSVSLYGKIASSGKTGSYLVSLDSGIPQPFTFKSGNELIYSTILDVPGSTTTSSMTLASTGIHTLQISGTDDVSLQLDYALVEIDKYANVADDEMLFVMPTSSKNGGVVLYEGGWTESSMGSPMGALDELVTRQQGSSMRFTFVGNSIQVMGYWTDLKSRSNPSDNIELQTTITSSQSSSSASPILNTTTLTVSPDYTISDQYFVLDFSQLDDPLLPGREHTINVTVSQLASNQQQALIITGILYGRDLATTGANLDDPSTTSLSALPSRTATSSRSPTSTSRSSLDLPRSEHSSPMIVIILLLVALVVGVIFFISWCWFKCCRRRKAARTASGIAQGGLVPGPNPPMNQQQGGYSYQQVPPSNVYNPNPMSPMTPYQPYTVHHQLPDHEEAPSTSGAAGNMEMPRPHADLERSPFADSSESLHGIRVEDRDRGQTGQPVASSSRLID